MEKLNIDIQYAIDNGIISIADVRESTEKMKREKILKEHGDLIKHYGDEWYFRIPDSTLKSGCFRRRSKSREHIENELCKYYMNLEKQNKEASKKDSMTFEQLFFEFMEYKKMKVCSDTIRRMMVDWNKFYKPNKEFIHKPFKEISKIDVDNFLNDIVNKNSIKDKAFRNMCGILKQTFEYALDCDYIDKSPYRVEINKKRIVSTKKKIPEKEVFTLNEQNLLINDMERRLKKNPSNNVPFAILLDFETGLRCGEILALKESDIIVENGTYKIHICRQLVKDYNITDLKNIKGNGCHIVEYTKSDCGDRYVPLTDKAIGYIKRIKETNETNGQFNDGYLFITDTGNIITESAVDSQLRNGCEKVKIPVRSMHKIRKTFASTLFHNGVSLTVISKLLGHADESTTLRYYIFNINDCSMTDSIVLNALSMNTPNETTTTSSEKRIETVTHGDTNVIQFPQIKKRKAPYKQRLSAKMRKWT